MNNQIFYFFYNFAHKSAFVDQLIIFIAHTLPYIFILVAGLFLLMHNEIFAKENPIKAFLQKWREITLAFFTGGIAWCIGYGLKFLIQAPRPYLALPNIYPLIEKTDFSFPSGHATAFMALAIAIYLSHKKVGRWFIFFALLIGLARIVAGVHFPIDILGGFILGAMVAYLINYFISRNQHHNI
ncbi:MAG: phosphatase PAP2 family protein [bacterium]|nr:phosphatase PAP2 family protein [bacterium]